MEYKRDKSDQGALLLENNQLQVSLHQPVDYFPTARPMFFFVFLSSFLNAVPHSECVSLFFLSLQEQLMKALCDSVCVSRDSLSTLIMNYRSHLQTVVTATQLRAPHQHSRMHCSHAYYTISTNPNCVLCSVCMCVRARRVEREMAEDSRVCEISTEGTQPLGEKTALSRVLQEVHTHTHHRLRFGGGIRIYKWVNFLPKSHLLHTTQCFHLI